MKTILRYGTLTLCCAIVLLKLGVIFWSGDPILSLFTIGVAIWNAIALSSLALLLIIRKTAIGLLYPIVLATIVTGTLSVYATGCCAMWWCEPDAQMGVVWLFLPIWEIILGGAAFAVSALIQLLVKRLRGPSRPIAS